MTTAVDRLLLQLEQRGLRVLPGAEPGQLVLSGPREEKTPAVLDAVRAFKPQLLERVATPREPADPEGETPDLGPPANPSIGEAKEVAYRLRRAGVILLTFGEDRSFAAASYGMTRPWCSRLRTVLDQIADALARGEIEVPE